ncbi:MAG: hypothetical protein J7M14_00565 [Planctomycetes bacterium]|nr:hypothetical protein [Planctomycetota bacterium]
MMSKQNHPVWVGSVWADVGKMGVEKMAEKKTLKDLVVKNLEQQLETAGITPEDLKKVNEIAWQVREKRGKIKELQEEIGRLKTEIAILNAEIQELTEPVKPVIGTINSNDRLRLVLIGLGLISEEAIRQFSNGFYKKGKRNGKGRKVIYKGKEYQSANALAKELAEQGKLRLPKSSYNAVRLLKRWANKEGLSFIERDETILIE